MTKLIKYVVVAILGVFGMAIILAIFIPLDIRLRSDSDNMRINSREKFMQQWNDSKISVVEETHKSSSRGKSYQTGEHVAYKQSDYPNHLVGSKQFLVLGVAGVL